MKAVTLLCRLIGSQCCIPIIAIDEELLLFQLSRIHCIDCSIAVLPFVIAELDSGTGVICFLSALTCSAFYLNEPRRFRQNCIFGLFSVALLLGSLRKYKKGYSGTFEQL